jgi:murein DD-endopeptidase MepM/ murein hydrolase activator NlpD
VGLLVLAPAAGRSAWRVDRGPGTERTHLVRRGETLTRIAARYRVPVKTLAAMNRLKSPNSPLRVGQRLVISRSSARPRDRRARAGLPAIPPDVVLSALRSDGPALALGWPVEGPVISPFGRRSTGWHRGLDIKAEMGTPILAAAEGLVAASATEPLYGTVTRIEHSRGFMTIYAHQLQTFVEVGEIVRAGQVIGQVGRTGRASTYHLHFEVRRDGRAHDPLQLLPPSPPVGSLARVVPEAPDAE